VALLRPSSQAMPSRSEARHGLCGHSDASVYFDPHLIRQATKRYVERGNAFGLVSHQGFSSLHRVSLPPTILQSVCAGRDAGCWRKSKGFSTRHEPTTSRITKDYHGTLRVGMHKADYAGRVRKNAIPLQDGLRMGSG
jgi:hypothetical protein